MMHATSLNISIRLATTARDVEDACAVRTEGYARHLPAQADAFGMPDAWDYDPGAAILLARDVHSGQALGTMRVFRNAHRPLLLEDIIPLPAWLSGETKAELTRFAVRCTSNMHVRLLLMKASYLFCRAHQVRWMILGARSRALIRMYVQLGFRDVFDTDTWVTLGSAGSLPHRILALDIANAERAWRTAGHRWYSYMIETYHPEIELFVQHLEAPPAARAVPPVPAFDTLD